ncbi:helix-turn-helix domain-containing protein [Paenibacillus larvae]
MTTLEQAIRSMIAEEITAAEKRIRESISTEPDRTLTFAEACKYLHVSDYTLRQLCREKRIPHRVIGSEGSRKPKYLFSTVSLDRWVREQEELNYQRS